MRTVVILTATVKPQTSLNLKRDSESERLRDYEDAIKFYLEKLTDKTDLIVVENSNSIMQLQDKIKFNSRLRLISAPLDSDSSFKGKSEGELAMLRFLSANGHLNEYEFCWKITGRLKVLNVNKIIESAEGYEIFVYRFKDGHSCDSRFFGMKTSIFQKFVNNPVKFDEITWNLKTIDQIEFRSLENYLAVFGARMHEAGFRIGCSEIAPRFKGYSASTGKQLDSKKSKIHYFLTKNLR